MFCCSVGIHFASNNHLSFGVSFLESCVDSCKCFQKEFVSISICVYVEQIFILEYRKKKISMMTLLVATTMHVGLLKEMIKGLNAN